MPLQALLSALDMLDAKSVFTYFSLLPNVELHDGKNHLFVMFIFPASNTELNNAGGIESNGMCSLRSMRHIFIRQVYRGFPSSLHHKGEITSCFQMHKGYNLPSYCRARMHKCKPLNSAVYVAI